MALDSISTSTWTAVSNPHVLKVFVYSFSGCNMDQWELNVQYGTPESLLSVWKHQFTCFFTWPSSSCLKLYQKCNVCSWLYVRGLWVIPGVWAAWTSQDTHSWCTTVEPSGLNIDGWVLAWELSGISVFVNRFLCSALDRRKPKFLPHYEVVGPVRPNSTIHMSSGCPFVDACPCAAHHYRQRPRSLSWICTLLPILLKTAEKLTVNPLLPKQSPSAKPFVQLQQTSRGKMSRAQSRAAGHNTRAAVLCPEHASAQSQAPHTLQTTSAALGAFLPAWDICGAVLSSSLASVQTST